MLVAAVLLAGLPAIAGAETGGAYRPPVDGPVTDPFRPPAGFGPGNRGIDFATEPGTPVTAAAGGEVTFAGPVGRSRHVVVLHPDGLRTSYSFLATVTVRRGDRVEHGQTLGTAAAGVHFGARAGDRYIDPTLLLGRPGEVHLVPVELRSPQPEARERAGLVAGLLGLVGPAGDLLGGGAEVADWLWDRTGDAAEMAVALARAEVEFRRHQLAVLADHLRSPVGLAFEIPRVLWRVGRLVDAQSGCTPADRAPPSPPPGRRIMLLVAGLGSSSGEAAVLGVDVAALGYPPADVALFSYAGGRVEGVGALAGVPTSTYARTDSAGDLRVAGARLRALLESVRAAHPGVPVDIVAHSQGGLVARSALGQPGDRHDPRLPAVDHVITLATPHSGADLASATTMVGATSSGGPVLLAADLMAAGAIETGSVAIEQMDEASPFLRELAGTPLPAATRFTSIAARGDLVVTALNSSLDGATNVVLPLDGLQVHAGLPSTPEARREIALALAGAGPTCRPLKDVVRDGVMAGAYGIGEGALTALAVGGALWADYRTFRGPSIPE